MGIESSPLRDHVIFVEGAHRSGTTWLLTLLATHPDIAGVEAESHLFDFGLDRLFDNFDSGPLPRLQSWVVREELVDLVRDLCDGVFLAMRDHVSAGTAPRFVVEKTPVNPNTGERDLARKREVYPDAWYLHLVRDREAVTKSLMRAPWIADRSYEACSRIWDTAVGQIRETFGDLERYRELSYEDLRANPGDALQPVFEWLGVSSREDALERVHVLSQQQFSDLGAVPEHEDSGLPRSPRGLASTVRGFLGQKRNRLISADDGAEGDPFAFRFVDGLRRRDADLLRSMTGSPFEFEYSAPDQQIALRGDEARDALAKLADEAFGRRYFREWWVAARGLSEPWASAAGKPFCSVFLSALGGDATRVDMAMCLAMEDGLIRRVVVVSAGPLSGRSAAG